MMIANPEGWQSVKTIIKEDPLWYAVLHDPHYTDIRNDEDMVVSEVLARECGKKNTSLLEEQVYKVLREDSVDKDYQANRLLFKMKEALNIFWDWVTTKLFNMKQFKDVNQIQSRVLYDLVNSTLLPQDKELNVQPQYSIGPAVNDNHITDAIVIRQGTGYAIRCKVDGIQQSALTLSPIEQQRYLQLQQSGDVHKIKEYKATLADKYFGGSKESEKQNLGLKR